MMMFINMLGSKLLTSLGILHKNTFTSFQMYHNPEFSTIMKPVTRRDAMAVTLATAAVFPIKSLVAAQAVGRRKAIDELAINGVDKLAQPPKGVGIRDP